MHIERLTPKHLHDFLQFHERVDLSHAPHWRGCYCQYYYLDDAAGDWQHMEIQTKRRLAEGRITSGNMNGYLAYEDGRVVGWMNIDDLTHYRRFAGDEDLQFAEKTAVIACMLLEPSVRGTGLTAEMITFALKDLKQQGFDQLIALPFENKQDNRRSYHGSEKLYLRLGFEQIGEDPSDPIYRYAL